MKPHSAHGQIRWLVIPAFFLIAFCWLGFASAKFAPIYHGLEDRLPVATRFTVNYGSIAYPLFGLFAAAAVILADIWFRSRLVWWTMVVVFTMLVLVAFRSFLFSGVFMGPAIKANQAHALDGGKPRILHIGCYCPAALSLQVVCAGILGLIFSKGGIL